MTRAKVALLLWAAAVGLPVVASVFLSLCVGQNSGTHASGCGVSTTCSNYSFVITEKDTDGSPRFLTALLNSAFISGIVAVTSVLVALPLARRIGGGPKRRLWNAGALALGLRVIPVTAPLPVFAWTQERLALSNGWFVACALYVSLLLPLACVLLSAADWSQIEMGQNVLAMDAPFRNWESLRYRVRAIAPDLSITFAAVFLLCWSDFVVAASFLPPTTLTLARLLANYQTFYGTQWGLLGTAIVLSIVPIVLLAIFALQVVSLRASASE
jgi:multiple sugar transport system permease protein